MNYRDEVFLSVAENLSFSKAAEDLFISQPAISKHIKEMESQMNISLFLRKGNKVYLTKAGKLTYSYLKEIKDKYKELEFDLGLLNNSFEGSLSIGASSTISQYLIPAVLAAFHKRYPKIKLDLFNGNSFQMEYKLLENDVDIAMVENESSQKDIRYLDFYDDEIVVVANINSVYAKRKNICISDFHEIPLVLREKGSGTLEVIQNSLFKKMMNLDKLNIFIHLGSTESIKNFLLDFDGIALVSEKAIEKELLLKQLVKINVNNFLIKRKFRIALREGKESLIPRLFIDFINQYNF